MRKTSTRRLLAGVTMLGFALACGSPPEEVAQETAPEAAAAHHEDDIAWFDGTVEEAFAHAEATDQPIFLYWGAIWCPPCHYLKEKIFSQPEFVAKSRQFVMVYLDGDTERAQVWGEKLDTQGYPTVLILNPQGEEVLRMTSGIPVHEYNEALDAAMSTMQPVDEVLARVLDTGPAEAPEADLEVLAYHSWGQDSSYDYSAPESLEPARRLWLETPSKRTTLRSRFLSHFVDVYTSQEDAPELSAEDRARIAAEFEALTSDPHLRRANFYTFAYGLSQVAELSFPEPGPERDALVDHWVAAAAEAENDEEMWVGERLAAVVPRIEAAELELGDDAEWPEELKQHVRDRMAWANETVTEPGELQSVMNTLANLLEGGGLVEEAKEILVARLDDALAPYYYMSWLGNLEEEAGNTEVAVDWYRKAWETSEGPSTRLRWGSSYVAHLVELVPEGEEQIQTAASSILGEHLEHEDALANRNRRGLDRISRALLEWAEEDSDRQEVVDQVKASVDERCSSFPDEGEDSARAYCESYLEPSAEEA